MGKMKVLGLIGLVSFCILNQKLAFAEVTATTEILSDQEKKLVAWIESKESEMLDQLTLWVEMNTGSLNKKGLDAYRELLDQELKQLGFATETHKGGSEPILTCDGGKMEFADHLAATRGSNPNKRIFLNGHMDTVFAVDDEFQKMILEPDGTIKGPGVVDMKGGILVLIYAMKNLHRLGRLDNAQLNVLFNSDEEVGSLSSRPIIEKMAQENDLGLIFEGTFKNRVTRERKGLGQARFKITGREAHAGSFHKDGVSANKELAHKIIEVEALTDYSNRVTINVGVMGGGEKRNTIPGCADAHVDLRYPDNHSGAILKEKVRQVGLTKYTHYPNYSDLPKSEVWVKLHRPAKEPHPGVDRLIAVTMGLSKLVGGEIVGTRKSGGGTDGSIAQSVGLPNLDSLGLDGVGAHSSREATSVDSLIARAKLVSVLLDRLINGDQKYFDQFKG